MHCKQLNQSKVVELPESHTSANVQEILSRFKNVSDGEDGLNEEENTSSDETVVQKNEKKR